MSIELQAATEQRIQRHLDQSGAREADQLVNRALDLLEADEFWSNEDKGELEAKLVRSLGEIERGEVVPGDQVRAMLAARRAERVR